MIRRHACRGCREVYAADERLDRAFPQFGCIGVLAAVVSRFVRTRNGIKLCIYISAVGIGEFFAALFHRIYQIVAEVRHRAPELFIPGLCLFGFLPCLGFCLFIQFLRQCMECFFIQCHHQSPWNSSCK